MRPIAGLTRAAREVARTRDPDVTLPKPRANDEVSDLANTLEDMLRELSAARGETEATLERQRDFVADASHELRTPLTSILANLELLESELTASSARWPSRRCARRGGCAAWWATCCCWPAPTPGREAPRAPGRPGRGGRARPPPRRARSPPAIRCRSTCPDPVTIDGVADDLHRLVGNLIENALIHTAAGHAGDRVGAPRAAMRRARGGRSRARRAAGAARARLRALRPRRRATRPPAAAADSAWRSCEAVAEAHGGRVELLDAEGGGARFVVTLPAGPAGAGALRSPPATVFRSLTEPDS